MVADIVSNSVFCQYVGVEVQQELNLQLIVTRNRDYCKNPNFDAGLLSICYLIMENFLKNVRNPYGFHLISMDDSKATIKMDDFEFTISTQTLRISSNEEFLETFVQNVNSANCQEFDALFERILKEYDVLMGIEDGGESPLYEEGQQVFELGNDNHDMKFTDRIRLNPDDFNMYLLLNVFEYLEPENTWKLSRVSKLWYSLTVNELLWKQYCKKYNYEQDCTSWKENYLLQYENTLKPKFDSMYTGRGVVFDETNTKILQCQNKGGKVFMTPSWDCTIEFNKATNYTMFGMCSQDEFEHIGVIPYFKPKRLSHKSV